MGVIYFNYIAKYGFSINLHINILSSYKIIVRSFLRKHLNRLKTYFAIVSSFKICTHRYVNKIFE